MQLLGSLFLVVRIPVRLMVTIGTKVSMFFSSVFSRKPVPSASRFEGEDAEGADFGTHDLDPVCAQGTREGVVTYYFACEDGAVLSGQKADFTTHGGGAAAEPYGREGVTVDHASGGEDCATMRDGGFGDTDAALVQSSAAGQTLRPS